MCLFSLAKKSENARGGCEQNIWRGSITSKLENTLRFSRGRNMWSADNIFLCSPVLFYRVLAKNFPKVRGFSQSHYKEGFVRKMLPLVPSCILVTQAA